MLSPFETAFTHAPIGMALVDPCGRLLSVNAALCRITGYTSEQLSSRPLRDLPDPQGADADIDVPRIVELLDRREPTYQIEKRFVHARGHLVWVMLCASLVRDDEGRPLHLIVQVQDISERKEREGRLERLVDRDVLTGLCTDRPFERDLAERVQRALTYDQLELYCQPILDLGDDQVSQYELLVRLRTEHGELLAPSAFLDVAGRFGTMLAIDTWVVRHAVALIASQAAAARPVTLHVNLSARSIRDPQLGAVIDRALADAHIDPAYLVFELTEAAAMSSLEHGRRFVAEFRNRGCAFALDDFGSGFASFLCLKHFPVDYLKIGGDFTRGSGAGTTDRLLLEAIVRIAKGMGKKTVAQFVSDRVTLDRVRRIGVDYAQGFHVGLPWPVADTFAANARRNPGRQLSLVRKPSARVC